MLFSGYALFKLKARAALKDNWQTALMIGLIASLPGMISQVVAILTGGDLAARLSEAVYAFSAVMTNPEAVVNDANQLLMDSISKQFGQSFLTSVAVSILCALISPCLMLGMKRYQLALLNGQADEVRSVFSCMRYWLKALGAKVMTVLKIVLWILPGYALMMGAVWLMTMNPPQTEEALYSMLSTISILIPIASAAVFVPAMMAMYRYAMVDYILAEKPETRIRDCFHTSKQMMKNRKMVLFGLEVSFIGWHLVLALITSLLQGMFGYVIGATASMFLNLVLTVYISTTTCCFYLALRNPATVGVFPGAADAPHAAQADAEDKQDDLN